MEGRPIRRTALILSLILAACGGGTGADTTLAPDLTTSSTSSTSTTTTTTIPPTTTTTLSPEQIAAAEFESDVQAIKQLWRGYSDSWLAGEDAGFAYVASHNYPAEECTAQDYEDLWEVAEGFHSEAIVDADTIERDDGWAIPSGNAAGTVPEGRIYIFTVRVIDSADGFDPVENVAEAHAAVSPEGDAYFFIDCRS